MLPSTVDFNDIAENRPGPVRLTCATLTAIGFGQIFWTLNDPAATLAPGAPLLFPWAVTVMAPHTPGVGVGEGLGKGVEVGVGLGKASASR